MVIIRFLNLCINFSKNWIPGTAIKYYLIVSCNYLIGEESLFDANIGFNKASIHEQGSAR